MTGESDRIARASDYVLGFMNERDRERAERDLEIDPAFRNAVMQLAERMHLFDRSATNEANRPWQDVAHASPNCRRCRRRPTRRPAIAASARRFHRSESPCMPCRGGSPSWLPQA